MLTGIFFLQQPIILRKMFVHGHKYEKIINAQFVYYLLSTYAPHNTIIINISSFFKLLLGTI